MCRHEPTVTLYGNAAASESVLETTVLQNNYTDMAASGVLVLINTFCMHNGTDLQASRAFEISNITICLHMLWPCDMYSLHTEVQASM